MVFFFLLFFVIICIVLLALCNKSSQFEVFVKILTKEERQLVKISDVRM